MTDDGNMKSTDAVILCGGLGTRLRQLSGDLPKVLMPVAGRPFIDILIASLRPFGFRRFILCVGHLKEKLQAHFPKSNNDIIFSEEPEPLGTGGALKNARPYIATSPFLLLNGDSICPTDLHCFYSFHKRKGGVLSIVLTRPLPESAVGCGIVEADRENRILSFREKTRARKGSYLNAGIYLANEELFALMPDVPRFSLEKDLLPAILPHGCFGFISDSELIDIGTRESYARAQAKADRIFLKK